MSDARNTPIVLLVEDSEDDCYIFRYALKKAQPNARFVSANDGVDALDYFQNLNRFADRDRFPMPDLVFLDLKMPGLDGFDVLRWMQQRSLLTTVKVIVLSGSSEPQDVALARELGARDYVVKPISGKRLQELLNA